MIGAAIGSSLIGAASSSRAASAQRSAARDQTELQERIYEEQSDLFRPYVDAGTNALSAYLYEMGLGSAPALDGVEYGGYTATPGYEFRLNEGLDALEGSAAARGGLFSGNAMQSALQYGQDYATSEYDNYLSRLSGLASNGQNAAGMQGAAAQNYGSSASNALAAYGNASAAGSIGVGNALQSGIQNLVGWNGYQSAQNGTTGTLGTLFGGSWAIN